MYSSKRNKCFTVVFIIAIIFIISQAADAGTVRKSFKKTYRFESGGQLSLENTNGEVYVESWSKNEVRIEADIKVQSRHRQDAEEFLKRVRIIVEDSPDEIYIETDYPRRNGGDSFLSFLFGRKTPSVSVNYKITVPRYVNLTLDTVNGGVQVEDVRGEIEVETTNGKIEIVDVEGTVEAHTTNGSIHTEVAEFSDRDEIVLKTVNGSISLYLPDDAQADVDASTVNGGIHTRFPLQVNGRWGGRNIRDRLNGGGGYVDLNTVNGSISIKKL